MKYQALRGFRDYLPPDAGARATLFATLRKVAQQSGFEEVETPSVESLELLKAKSGEGIVGQTFAFTDKGGREVTLIPENTPSVARLIVERAKSMPTPVKWFALPKLWRYEEPQAGRLREFSQVSLDIFGAPGIDAEIEILATTKAMLDALGLGGRYVFRVNDRRLLEGLAIAFGVKEVPGFFRAMDRSKKVPPAQFREDLVRTGLPAPEVERFTGLLDRSGPGPAAREILDSLATTPGLPEVGRTGIENLRQLLMSGELAGLSDILILDLSIVRGLAYYTSTVFECFDSGQTMRSLFGGGRYDRLVELFGGPSLPACGVAIGDQTLEMLLRESKLWPTRSPVPDVYVAVAGDGLRSESIAWVGRLRASGLSVERDIMGRSLSAQMKEAARRGARTLVLLAPEERARNEVVVRNMQTGQQASVAADAAESEIRKVLTAASAPPPPGA